MPEISRFLGIIITMHWSEPRHNLPHFHVRYNEYKALISIEELKIIEGVLHLVFRDWLLSGQHYIKLNY
jgi:hypothetical protein